VVCIDEKSKQLLNEIAEQPPCYCVASSSPYTQACEPAQYSRHGDLHMERHCLGRRLKGRDTIGPKSLLGNAAETTTTGA